MYYKCFERSIVTIISKLSWILILSWKFSLKKNKTFVIRWFFVILKLYKIKRILNWWLESCDDVWIVFEFCTYLYKYSDCMIFNLISLIFFSIRTSILEKLIYGNWRIQEFAMQLYTEWSNQLYSTIYKIGSGSKLLIYLKIYEK